MAGSLAVASQLFSYLKRTVSNLTEPYNKPVEQAKGSIAKSSTPQPLLADSVGLALNVQRQKRRSCSPSFGTKRTKNGSYSSMVVASAPGRFDGSESMQIWSQAGYSNENTEDNIEDGVICLNSIFNQLLWTLKYLKYNPFKTNEELIGIIGTLCEGLQKILVLSRLNFTDTEFRRFLRIANTLFSLVISYEDENSVRTSVRINMNVENLFDNFLDHFTEADSNAEGHLKIYGFLSAIMYQLTSDDIITMLKDKLILRIYSTTTALWEACVSCPNGSVQLVNPVDVNLFFFYCQLLEALITTAPITGQKRLQESVRQNLIFLEEDAGSLFSMFPNLAFILYSTILATGSHQKSNVAVSPLKEIK